MLEIPTFFQHEILVEFRLQQPSTITMQMFDDNDNLTDLIFENQPFASGKHILKICKRKLKKGSYQIRIYTEQENLHLTHRVIVP